MTQPMAKNKNKSAVRTPKPKELPSITIRPSILRDPYDGLIPDAATIAKANAELDAIKTGAVTGPTSPLTGPLTSPLIGGPTRELTGGPARELARELIGEPAGELTREPTGEPARELAGELTREPAREPAILRSGENNKWLDATHTANEQRIYSVMYRVTISKGMQEGYFSVPSLKRATGIGGEDTVRKHLRGLCQKLSVKVVGLERERTIGRRYRVFSPREIEQNRAEAGIVVDPITKAIIDPSRGPARGPAGGPVGYLAGELLKAPSGPLKKGGKALSNQEGMYNHVITSGPDQPSSAPGDRDDGKLTKVKKLFEQLSNGGKWKDDRDLQAYEQIAHIGISHIILGLCYSVSKSPEHRMSSLAYAVQSILKHAEDMDAFQPEQLIEIAYKTQRTTMNCIAEGKWTVPEWET